MQKLRPEERWAASMIGAALDVPVEHHDDGSQPGMYDLRICYPGATFGAVEVTASADEDAIELWNLVNGGDGYWTVPADLGGWTLSLRLDARVKHLRTHLTDVLAELDMRGVTQVHSEWTTRRDPPILHLIDQLGIASMSRVSNATNSDRVYFTVELPTARMGGAVPDHGDSLAEWASEFLADDRRAGDREKLAKSGGAERHIFIWIVGFSDASWPVPYLALSDPIPLPTIAPTLADPVTHVWIASTFTTTKGLRWTRVWELFEKVWGDASDLVDKIN